MGPSCNQLEFSGWLGKPPRIGLFVFVQQVVGKELQTYLDYPPTQHGASFNLDAVKAEMSKRMQEAEAASHGPSN